MNWDGITDRADDDVVNVVNRQSRCGVRLGCCTSSADAMGILRCSTVYKDSSSVEIPVNIVIIEFPLWWLYRW